MPLEVLERLEADDVRPPRAEAGVLGYQTGTLHRGAHRLRLEERDVDLRDHVGPLAEALAVRRRVARREEHQPAGRQQRAHALELGDGVGDMLEDLDRGDDVEATGLVVELLEDRHTALAQAGDAPPLLEAGGLDAPSAQVGDEAAGAAAVVQPARLRPDGRQRCHAHGDPAPLVAPDRLVGVVGLEVVVDQRVGTLARVVGVGVDRVVVRPRVRDEGERARWATAQMEAASAELPGDLAGRLGGRAADLAGVVVHAR